MSPTRSAETWKENPDDHDYPAAESYLSLLMPPAKARQVVGRLREAGIARHKAKDLLRSSRLPPLPPDNFHVARDIKKVKAGKKLSPVLLVRGQLGSDLPLIVADGYHIPCRIVDANSR
jgi:hypothetical protein